LCGNARVCAFYSDPCRFCTRGLFASPVGVQFERTPTRHISQGGNTAQNCKMSSVGADTGPALSFSSASGVAHFLHGLPRLDRDLHHAPSTSPAFTVLPLFSSIPISIHCNCLDAVTICCVMHRTQEQSAQLSDYAESIVVLVAIPLLVLLAYILLVEVMARCVGYCCCRPGRSAAPSSAKAIHHQSPLVDGPSLKTSQRQVPRGRLVAATVLLSLAFICAGLLFFFNHRAASSISDVQHHVSAAELQYGYIVSAGQTLIAVMRDR